MALTTTVQKIRLLVGDKDANSDGTGDVYGLTDDEVQFAYDQITERDGTGNIYLAAADLLRGIAAKLTDEALSISTANFTRSTASQPTTLITLAESYEKRAQSEPAGGAAETAWTDAVEAEIVENKWERES